MPGTRPQRDAGGPHASRALRIAIVDDHPVVRQGLRAVINNTPGMTVCSESDTAEGGLASIRRDRPDVAIVDLTLGLDSGLDVVKALNASVPDVRILILSMHDEVLHADRALAAGARGYIMKHTAKRDLLAAIRCVASGKTYVSPQMSERIMARVSGRSDARVESPATTQLTNREREVFALIGRGMETRDIAARMNLSVKTIETYYAHIKEKLGLRSGHELVRVAVSWTSPDRS